MFGAQAAFMDIYRGQESFGKRIGGQLILKATVPIRCLLFMGTLNYTRTMALI